MRDLSTLVSSLQADKQTLLAQRFEQLVEHIAERQALAQDNITTLEQEIHELTEQIMNSTSPPLGTDQARQERFNLERERRMLTRELRMTPIEEWRDLQHLLAKAEDLTTQLREEQQRQERINTIMSNLSPYGSLPHPPTIPARIYEPLVGGVPAR